MVARPPPEITDEDLKSIDVSRVRNGHTRKVINRSIMARRHMLHTLMAIGNLISEKSEVKYIFLLQTLYIK
jgi:hypothetical protein